MEPAVGLQPDNLRKHDRQPLSFYRLLRDLPLMFSKNRVFHDHIGINNYQHAASPILLIRIKLDRQDLCHQITQENNYQPIGNTTGPVRPPLPQ